MPNYDYLGCVTGVTESGTTQLIQPTQSPMPVVRDANAYTERLVAVALLVGGEGGTDGGVDVIPPVVTPPVGAQTDFLKMTNPLIAVDEHELRVVYSLNGGAITAATYSEFENVITPNQVSLEPVQVLQDIGAPYFASLKEASLLLLPATLDSTKGYFLGFNKEFLIDCFTQLGATSTDMPPITEKVTTLTIYPNSKLPSEYTEMDVFDYIIDPATYTEADLAYFAKFGMTPITKNADGSYTLYSQAEFPML